MMSSRSNRNTTKYWLNNIDERTRKRNYSYTCKCTCAIVQIDIEKRMEITIRWFSLSRSPIYWCWLCHAFTWQKTRSNEFQFFCNSEWDTHVHKFPEIIKSNETGSHHDIRIIIALCDNHLAGSCVPFLFYTRKSCAVQRTACHHTCMPTWWKIGALGVENVCKNTFIWIQMLIVGLITLMGLNWFSILLHHTTCR